MLAPASLYSRSSDISLINGLERYLWYLESGHRCSAPFSVAVQLLPCELAASQLTVTTAASTASGNVIAVQSQPALPEPLLLLLLVLLPLRRACAALPLQPPSGLKIDVGNKAH